MLDFTTLFVDVDDCWKNFAKNYAACLIDDGVRKRSRKSNLSISEIMTIVIAFQTSGFRTFKGYYQSLLAYHKPEFPGLVSYDRFVYLIPVRWFLCLCICRTEVWMCRAVSLLSTVRP